MSPALSQSDPLAPVIFGVTLVLTCALLGRLAARRLGQPTVVGELLVGIMLGNGLHWLGYDLITLLREGVLCFDLGALTLQGESWETAVGKLLGPETGAHLLAAFRGPHGAQYLQVAQAVDMFSRYGVIFLLFYLGLGAGVARLRQARPQALAVAATGVLAPFALGLMVVWLLLPQVSISHGMFIAATLTASSMRVTGRMLARLGRADAVEAPTILSAALIDDVVGLTLLAILAGVGMSGQVSLREVTGVALLVAMVFSTAVLAGPRISGPFSGLVRRMAPLEAKLLVSLVLVLVLAGIAVLLGVSSFVGAFAAGLLMADSHSDADAEKPDAGPSVAALFAPLEAVLVPVLFVLVGTQVKLELFLDGQVLAMAAALLVAAVIGKLLSGLAAPSGRGRLRVGIGMIPRGEVGLAFALIGKTAGIIDAAVFSILVLLVVASTLMAPPLLRMAFERDP